MGLVFLGAPVAFAQIPDLPTGVIGSPSPSPSPSGSSSPTPGPNPNTQSTPSPAGSTPAQQTVGPTPFIQVPEIVRTPSQTTTRLLAILAPLEDRGMPLDQAVVLAAAPFPVAGQALFSDDFGFPRTVPVAHSHEGNDIFADFGTPIVASSAGAVAGMADTLVGGLSVWVAADDGTGYYYAHLLSFAEGVVLGGRVDAGTVLGYVGNTGDAIGTSPHLHFEVHPPILGKRGKVLASGVTSFLEGTARTNTPAVDPKPYLDAWLMQAEVRAQGLVIEVVRRFAAVARELYLGNSVEKLSGSDDAPDAVEMVWPSIFEPTLTAMGMADDLARSALSRGAMFDAEAARIQAVRLAMWEPQLRLSAFTGMPLLDYPLPSA